MFIQLVFLATIHVLLPILFLWSLWKSKVESMLEWGTQALFTTLFISWIFLASPWDWFSYYLRFLWIILLVLLLVTSFRKCRDLPFLSSYTRAQKGSLLLYGVLVIVFGMYNVFAISGMVVDEDAVELSFPLKNGTYYVGQGGSHEQINYHNVSPVQEFAIDVVELNGWGARANGIYPEDLEAYAIYGRQLFSPCKGEVLASRNQLEDLSPPDSDPDHPEGNFVEIHCEAEDVKVYIAHMKKGSVRKEEGHRVSVGEAIGRVGNSGNTSEPHLHMHAVRDGEGVPLLFDDRFLVRNDLVFQ